MPATCHEMDTITIMWFIINNLRVGIKLIAIDRKVYIMCHLIIRKGKKVVEVGNRKLYIQMKIKNV